MLFNNFNTLYLLNSLTKDDQNSQNTLNYSFSFISLITPSNLINFRLLFNFSKTNKIILKQSYLMLTWFFYLSFLEKNDNLHFFIFPLKKKKFTLTKAPIAHKNWSKEQYKFQFYKIKLSLNSKILHAKHANSLNAGALLIFLNKKYFPQFETNLLFLKSNSFIFYFSDISFFNFYIFYLNFFK